MYENIHIKYPNFCLGPAASYFCSINQDDATTILRIKTSAGSLIADYSLSSNIVNELIHLEYVGPYGITTLMDGLTFFTVEKVDSTKCIIKRYEMRTSSNQLNLKHQIVKYTTGLYYYDIRAAAIEHYERTFTLHNPGETDHLEINSTNKITSGTRLFLGPSNDGDNEGVSESVIVSHVIGSTVYLTSDLVYQYVIGDQISFYTDVYLISNLGMGGDTSRGTIFKIDADSGSVNDVNTDKVYRNIDAARWCVPTQTIAAISNYNMLFINPYASYYNWKSIYLNNLEDDNSTHIPIYDVLFEDTAGIPVYLLATKRTVKDDDGNRTTEDWGTWCNYIPNTLSPYSNNIEIYTDKSVIVGDLGATTLYVKVVDQFGVGLLGKTVYFFMSPEGLGEFTPLGAQVDTDSNGEANILFTFSAAPDDIEGRYVEITCKTDGSSPESTGSAYVWNSIKIFQEVKCFANEEPAAPNQNSHYLIYTVTSGIEGNVRTKTIASGISNEMGMYTKSFFTNPGGNWSQTVYSAEVPIYLPVLVVGDGEGPQYSFSVPVIGDPTEWNPMPNTIHQVEEFESVVQSKQLKNFKCLTEWGDTRSPPVDAFVYEEPYSIVQQIIESFDLQLSQLKTSGHTHWIGATPYDYLWTYADLNQFIFVEDAIPKFWSLKNPIDTDIWIRLRPYAYSLSQSTVRMFVREIWWNGDTGYVDVTSQLSINDFDAGGGVLGLELTYNPSQDFHHNSIVYVFIEVYDIAPSPNRITTSYWFEIIPDYKSPYLENLSPSREQDNVDVDTDVYFEIKDAGTGVNIDTLELYINSRIVIPTNIVKVSDHHYKVTYTPPTNFFFDKRITVGVIVNDSTEYDNWLNDRYAFYTAESDEIYFTEFLPGACKRGLSRFTDVSFLALGIGSGIDKKTLRLQIRERDVTDQSVIVPVIYRIS